MAYIGLGKVSHPHIRALSQILAHQELEGKITNYERSYGAEAYAGALCEYTHKVLKPFQSADGAVCIGLEPNSLSIPRFNDNSPLNFPVVIDLKGNLLLFKDWHALHPGDVEVISPNVPSAIGNLSQEAEQHVREKVQHDVLNKLDMLHQQSTKCALDNVYDIFSQLNMPFAHSFNDDEYIANQLALKPGGSIDGLSKERLRGILSALVEPIRLEGRLNQCLGLSIDTMKGDNSKVNLQLLALDGEILKEAKYSFLTHRIKLPLAQYSELTKNNTTTIIPCPLTLAQAEPLMSLARGLAAHCKLPVVYPATLDSYIDIDPIGALPAIDISTDICSHGIEKNLDKYLEDLGSRPDEYLLQLNFQVACSKASGVFLEEYRDACDSAQMAIGALLQDRFALEPLDLRMSNLIDSHLDGRELPDKYVKTLRQEYFGPLTAYKSKALADDLSEMLAVDLVEDVTHQEPENQLTTKMSL